MTSTPLHPDIIEFLDDRSLLEEYQQTAGEPGDRLADDLLAEIQRRNLVI